MCICSGFGFLKFPSGSEHAVVRVTAKYKANGKEATRMRRERGRESLLSWLVRQGTAWSAVMASLLEFGNLEFWGLGRTIFEYSTKRLFSACFTVQALAVVLDWQNMYIAQLATLISLHLTHPFKQLDCMQTTQEPAWLESIWFLCSMFSRTWTASLPLSPTSFEQCKLLIHSLQCYMVSFENGSWFFRCLCLVLPVTWIKW